ncbi:mannitol-1-phosphate 5-dehydrogenase [Bacteroidota bacterium]
MNNIKTNKLVLFGAGKIGRSFIAQLFSLGDYEVVFIDVAKPIIDELNRRGNYKVIIKAEREEVLNIGNVRGVLFSEEQSVIDEISSTGILAVSVGSAGLASSIPLIAKGLLKRYEYHRENPLDIIIAENLRNAADYMKKRLKINLPDWYPIESHVGLIETSIGKMVPIMLKKDMEKDVLQVFAEPYNTLILDKLAFKNPIPRVEGLAPKENMKAWVDRKLFIHNLGHVSAAYCGSYHYPEASYMYEVLAHDKIRSFTRETMHQSSKVLDALYPGVFSSRHFHEHIEDLIARFRNKALGDTVFRVGCDLQRKLSSDDRLLAPFHAGIRHNIPVDKIAEAIFYGTHFSAKDENGNLLKSDAEFFNKIEKEGLETVLKKTCKLDDHEYGIVNKQFQKHGKSDT